MAGEAHQTWAECGPVWRDKAGAEWPGGVTLGLARPGEAGAGQAGLGMVRIGMAGQAWRGLAWQGAARQGWVRRGKVWHGTARQGKADTAWVGVVSRAEACRGEADKVSPGPD